MEDFLDSWTKKKKRQKVRLYILLVLVTLFGVILSILSQIKDFDILGMSGLFLLCIGIGFILLGVLDTILFSVPTVKEIGERRRRREVKKQEKMIQKNDDKEQKEIILEESENRQQVFKKMVCPYCGCEMKVGETSCSHCGGTVKLGE